MSDAVDIDKRPHVQLELAARVALGSNCTVLEPVNSKTWSPALEALLGEVVSVTVTRAKRTRSGLQNNYLWGMVYPDVLSGLRELAVNAGGVCPFISANDLHEAMKYMVLGLEVITLPGAGTLARPSTTTKLDSAQFSDYVSRIIRWAGERGISVRAPGDEQCSIG